ncbi:DUF6249 domain-containing protein [Caulobacter mirabilis]|uniref:DUF6249 domain-containing protein n=1 Tax=Caulobacter mirabilis TaxID=69666 RepID=A0A2D2AZ26_9CAUL|nr:DUF6249 domain-containing protein [Caulobacter mirabilis]ATQ43278.1 hypothetical protein CSW64_13040 [Caulobacter mirabilis]
MEILIPITLFAMIAAIVLVPSWLKSRERREMQETLRSAIDKGLPLPSEVIDAMTKNVKVAPTALSDIRTGIVWLSVGIGIGLLGFIIGFREADAFHPLLGMAAIPTMIGVAFIALSFVNPNKGKQS